jgi:hypothetical protein
MNSGATFGVHLMLFRKACLHTVVGILVAASAYADVIPFFGGNYKRYSYLEMTTQQLPPGMVLLLLDDEENLVARAHGKELMMISRPGKVYLAREDQLSTPFSYRTDKKKLNKLKSFRQEDLPWRKHVQPTPEQLDCTLSQDQPDKFQLVCARSSKEN